MSEPTVPVRDVLAASEGMLQKQLYVVFTRPHAGLVPVLANMDAHLAFVVAAERKGQIFAAGPFWSDDGRHWEGEGMMILRATSKAEAEEIADGDPMHASGARTYSVRPWLLNEGSLTIRLTYSDGASEVL